MRALQYVPASPKKPSRFLADFRVSNNEIVKRSSAPLPLSIIANRHAVTRSLFALLGSVHHSAVSHLLASV